jgi:hypothetical protein
MEQKINIRIPEPCHEDWGQMSSAEKGRFCNSCSKIVVDFTVMQNQEIIDYFKEASGARTCGRFRMEQLAPPLPAPIIQQSVFKRYFSYPLQRIAAVLITGLTLFLTSCKPSVKGEISTEKPPVDTTFSGTTDSSHTSVITGDTVIEQPKPVRKPEPKIDRHDILGEPAVEPVMQGISIMEPDPVESFPMGKIRIDVVDTIQSKTQK